MTATTVSTIWTGTTRSGTPRVCRSASASADIAAGIVADSTAAADTAAIGSGHASMTTPGTVATKPAPRSFAGVNAPGRVLPSTRSTAFNAETTVNAYPSGVVMVIERVAPLAFFT